MRSPSRTTAWSSTIRIRITAATSSRTRVPAPGAERISIVPPSSCARSSIEVRPRCRERSSARAGIEADAVVGDLHLAGAEPDADVLGAGVAKRVVERLVHDPQHRQLALRVGAVDATRR